MYFLLTMFGLGVALVVGVWVYGIAERRRRWPCPRCGASALRIVGTAAIYPALWMDGPFDIRFAKAHCEACNQPSYRRLVRGAPWEPEMRAVPVAPPPAPPPPPAPTTGRASEIVFDEAGPTENRRDPHE
jgi:hypothetical protein